MNRLLFEKTGDAVYISHLDLMRVFQRAFRRAGFLLRHTGGFNQHAYVSLALPLSVGTASVCEILDYELDEPVDGETLKARLNRALPAGILVREVYESAQKLRELSLLQAEVELQYDAGVPEGAVEALTALFDRETIIVSKKTKKGPGEVDLKPMLRSCRTEMADAHTVRISCVVAAQNPSMNPMLLETAVGTHLPDLRPDFARCRRLEVLTAAGVPFR